jgi:hypothetical protein
VACRRWPPWMGRHHARQACPFPTWRATRVTGQRRPGIRAHWRRELLAMANYGASGATVARHRERHRSRGATLHVCRRPARAAEGRACRRRLNRLTRRLRQSRPGSGWDQACRHLPIPRHRLPSTRRKVGDSLLALGRGPGGVPARPPAPRTRPGRDDTHGGTAAVGHRTASPAPRPAPAPGHGPAVVAATRPIPRRSRPTSRARGVPAGPPAAAPDPGPGGAGRHPRRPRGGRSQAGRGPKPRAGVPA